MFATKPMRRMLVSREAQTLREVFAHLVAVEDLDLLAALLQERRQEIGERALAAAGEAREPESETFVGHGVVANGSCLRDKALRNICRA
jgi:hypothetical protein